MRAARGAGSTDNMTAIKLTRHERAPAGEDAAIAEILRIIKLKLGEQFPPGRGDMRRDAHPKHHGAVRAELVIEPNLPAELAVGVFAASRSYPAWVRFSNGSGTVQPDHLPDGRGIAIKLMDVPG